MKSLIVASTILLAGLAFGTVGASADVGYRAVAPEAPAQVAPVVAPAAAVDVNAQADSELDYTPAAEDPTMGNCTACDADKSKGACAGKSSCKGSASDCRKRGCRVKGTTSKCSSSC